MRWAFGCFLALAITSPLAVPTHLHGTPPAADPYDPQQILREVARSHIYKVCGSTMLTIHAVYPADHRAGDRRPAVVFFFGGAWRSGSPAQFLHQSRYLASRGMVAMMAEYRVHSRHDAQVVDCVADAKSAIRWVRGHAAELGIDPSRIAAAGGSAGGHLAASAAFLPAFDEPDEDLKISSQPSALVLFNPVLDLRPQSWGPTFRQDRYAEIRRRLGAAPENLTPLLHIQAPLPPTIIFHGTADDTVPLQQAEDFAEQLQTAGGGCELVRFAGQDHGFFNWGRDRNQAFLETMRQTDEFFQALGWLAGDPTIEQFVQSEP